MLSFFLNSYYEQNIYINNNLNNLKQYSNFKGNIDTLIFGDSHATYALNPKYFKKSFNLSNPGEDYIQTYFKFKSILKGKSINKEYKNIILPIDPNNFLKRRLSRTEDELFYKNIMNYFSLGINTGNYLVYFRKFLNSYLFSYYGKWRNIWIHINKYYSNEQETSSRYIMGHIQDSSSYEDKGDLKDQAQLAVSTQFKDVSRLIDPNIFEYFLKIIKEHPNIHFYLIRFPLSDHFKNQIKTRFDLIQFYNEMTNQLKALKNVEILNYQDLFSKDYNFYHDTEHLNKKGSIEFSKLIDRKINEIN